MRVLEHFHLPKWIDPTSQNTFYSPKNLALSDKRNLKKIQDGVFEQLGGNIDKFCQFRKKGF